MICKPLLNDNDNTTTNNINDYIQQEEGVFFYWKNEWEQNKYCQIIITNKSNSLVYAVSMYIQKIYDMIFINSLFLIEIKRHHLCIISLAISFIYRHVKCCHYHDNKIIYIV